MNIVEILKNAPEGTKLYSPMFGECEFVGTDFSSNYCIAVKHHDDHIEQFTKDGRYYIDKDAKCILFPSKENRDWSTFKVEKSYEFKPFDKVLVRDTNEEQWRCNIYSHKESDVVFPYKCIYAGYKQCIPFEGYEDLVGTTTSPDSIYPA